MFNQRLLDKTCTVIVVTLLYGCQISVLSAFLFDFIKYKLTRSNADSFHHHLAYLPNRKLYPNIRCRCGLDTVITFIFKSKKEVSLSEVFALFNWSSAGYMSGICFSNSGLSMVKISSRYRKVSLNISMRSNSHSQKCDPTRRKSCRTHSLSSKNHSVHFFRTYFWFNTPTNMSPSCTEINFDFINGV